MVIKYPLDLSVPLSMLSDKKFEVIIIDDKIILKPSDFSLYILPHVFVLLAIVFDIVYHLLRDLPLLLFLL